MSEKCFKDREELEDLVECVSKKVFDCLKEEPSFKSHEEFMKQYHPEANEQKISEGYRMQVQDYANNLRILTRLQNYGNTRTEIIANLRQHLFDCGPCRNDYLAYLDERARESLEKANEIITDIKMRENARAIITKGYEGMRRWFDKLGFLLPSD